MLHVAELVHIQRYDVALTDRRNQTEPAHRARGHRLLTASAQGKAWLAEHRGVSSGRRTAHAEDAS